MLMPRLSVIKTWSIVLLIGFILFNLISLVFAHTIAPEPTTNKCQDGHILLGGQCYDKSSEELFERIKRAASIQNAGPGGKCPENFHYIEGKCYNAGSAQYNEILKQASAAAGAREAASNATKPTIPTGSKIQQSIREYKTQVPIPCDPSFGLGSCPSLQTPAGYIARIYQFGLMIVGLLAFGGIVYGALKYILSAGNVGSQQDAKDQITQAVLGLVLLLGAFIILYTINPSLTFLRNPNAPVLDLSVLTPPEEEGGQKQDLIGGGGEGDPLCAAALDAGVNLNISGQAKTGKEVGEVGQAVSKKAGEILGSSGEKRTGPQCLKCVANASGASGLFSKCVCDPGYEQTGSKCIKK
ncbi:MAG: hypothetical protein HYY86_01520 [Candidatus Harrisonbacteria bacterium]|nr:hypothetical protein [Candidatus Harrisonbacteria bacterium]